MPQFVSGPAVRVIPNDRVEFKWSADVAWRAFVEVFMKISDSPERPRGFARRGFLRRAGTMAAGGLAAAALPERLDAVSLSARPTTGAPRAPVLGQAGARPGEPYFFRIETTGAARTATAPAVKEV